MIETRRGEQVASVVEINRPEEMHRYRMAWNALFAQTQRASFFHTFEWLMSYWKDADPATKFRVLVIRCGRTITGIVPLCIVREEHRLQTLRVLTYPLSDWGTCYGPIGPNQSASLFMAMRYLRSTPRDWDLIDLRWIARENLADEATGRAMRAASWNPQVANYATSSLVEFRGGTWEGYLATRCRKTRQELRRQRRRLAESAHVEFIRHRPRPAAEGDGDPNRELFEECLEVSRQSWQAGATDGNTLGNADVADFLRDCHAEAARLGMLDLAVLKADGRVVAFQYNYQFDGRVLGLRMGYLPTERSRGVGTILMSYLLEDGFRRQDESLDLGSGELDFKLRLRTKTLTTWHYSYTPWMAWKAQSVRVSRWINRHRASRPAPGGKAASA